MYDDVNKVRFEVRDSNGQKLWGTVTANIVALEDQLTAYSLIELDDQVNSG